MNGRWCRPIHAVAEKVSLPQRV